MFRDKRLAYEDREVISEWGRMMSPSTHFLSMASGGSGLTLLSVCMYMCMPISVGAQLYVGACVHVWRLAITLECHSSGTWFLTQGFDRVSYWPGIHQLCGSQATSQRWDHKHTPHHHHHAWHFHLGLAN